MATSDVISVVRFYIEKVLKQVKGMKVLLLDPETTKIVSLVYGQTEILKHEVFLVERLDSERKDQLLHLKAVCFLRPTRENIALLRQELREPHYGEYSLFFTNRLEDMRLQDLAEMDIRELVSEVHEFFGDFSALDPFHFCIPLPKPHVALQPFNFQFGESSEALSRLTEGIASVILSLRRRFNIRYQRGSEMCQKLAQALHHLTMEEERALFDFGSRAADENPLVLILDRKDDPVTPMLLQWTYQAMVHELLGISNNLVSLKDAPGVKADFKEIVLSARQDEFFQKHMSSNFGDFALAASELLVEVAQQKKGQTKHFSSLQDMRNFLDNARDFSAAEFNASKHAVLASELQRLEAQRSLMQVSAVEQEVSCSNSNLQSHYDAVSQLVNNPDISDSDRVRLVGLFALRYEREGGRHVESLAQRLRALGVPQASMNGLECLLNFAGTSHRVGDLYSDRTFRSRFVTMAKHAAGLRGVENVYTQHVPLLVNTLESLIKGRLKEADFPHVRSMGGAPAKPPKLVIVFMVGGSTYEEARSIAELNSQSDRADGGWAQGLKFILGGTSVQNSRTFLNDMAEMAANAKFH
ncbi:hypothetical protein WJX73_010485 [Symbiochloris irregularis]|uniref:Vacuolar protein sorting-associated protein 45 n=1 Tax=Symbiochloris irregularis TaxID=706552 RepID=A0AAW1NZB4_9CHLO